MSNDKLLQLQLFFFQRYFIIFAWTPLIRNSFILHVQTYTHTHTHNLTMVIRNVCDFFLRQYFLCRQEEKYRLLCIKYSFDWIHTLHGWTSKLIGQWENNYVHRIVRKLKTKKNIWNLFFAQLYVINLFIVGFTFPACVCVMYKICGRMNFAKKKE